MKISVLVSLAVAAVLESFSTLAAAQSFALIDSTGKAVGFVSPSSGQQIAFLKIGSTQLPWLLDQIADASGKLTRGLVWTNGNVFYTSDNCSGQGFIAPDPRGSRIATATVKGQNGWIGYVGKDENPTIQTIQSTLTNAGCASTPGQGDTIVVTVDKAFSIATLGTPPFFYGGANQNVSGAAPQVVDATGRVIGQYLGGSPAAVILRINNSSYGVSLTAPINADGTAVDPSKITFLPGTLFFVSNNCSGQAYRLGGHVGLAGTPQSVVMRDANGKFWLYPVSSGFPDLNVTFASMYNSSLPNGTGGGCVSGVGDKGGIAVGVPFEITNLYSQPFEIRLY